MITNRVYDSLVLECVCSSLVKVCFHRSQLMREIHEGLVHGIHGLVIFVDWVLGWMIIYFIL